jgi:hypothetical protein
MGVREGRKLSLAVLAALVPLAHARPASAEPFQTAGGGLFIGYAFGERGGVEWGIEGFATRYLEKHSECNDSSSRRGFGPLLRLASVRTSRLELTLAAHGGGELPKMRSYFAIDGEIGASLFLEKGHEARVAPHTGVTFESIIFNLYFRQEWVEPSASVGGGARFIPTFGLPGFCASGRPYRGANGRPRPAGLHYDASFDQRCPAARRWARRTVEEGASVPAFLQLASELVQLAAPPELVQRALRAAREELGHTVAAARLAGLFGGGGVQLALPPFLPRAMLPRPLALRRLVAESWLDGVLNEGVSAAVAEAEAAQTRVAEEADASRQIAREEAGHARLAFDVLRWALRQAPELRSLLWARRGGAAPAVGVTSLDGTRARALSHECATRAARQWSELVG